MPFPIRIIAVAAPFTLATIIACCTTPGSSEIGPAPLAALPDSTPGQAATGSVTGTWSSLACGDRTYERRISLAADGSFTAEDRVAPCPPTVLCVWSGIVTRRGTYAIAAGAIQLAPEGPIAGPGQPLPSSLVIDATGAPVEMLADGTQCPYSRLP